MSHIYHSAVGPAGVCRSDAMTDNQASNGDNASTILDVKACFLAKHFRVPYEESMFYAAFVQPTDSPQLTTAQRNMQAAGIPLALSPTEQRWQVC